MLDWSYNEAYPTRRDAALALAEVVRQEAEDLDAAGAQYIQIDEPAIHARPEELAIAIEAMGIVTQNLKAKTISHICYGDFAAIYLGHPRSAGRSARPRDGELRVPLARPHGPQPVHEGDGHRHRRRAHPRARVRRRGGGGDPFADRAEVAASEGWRLVGR